MASRMASRIGGTMTLVPRTIEDVRPATNASVAMASKTRPYGSRLAGSTSRWSWTHAPPVQPSRSATSTVASIVSTFDSSP